MIRDRLLKNKADLTERFWAVAEHPTNRGRSGGRHMLAGGGRLGCVRSRFRPLEPRESPRGRDLGVGDAASLGMWMNALRPVNEKLLDPLADIFRDRRPDRAIERSLATSVLADYASESSECAGRPGPRCRRETISRPVRKLETFHDRASGRGH